MENIVYVENFQKICRTCLKMNDNLLEISVQNIIEMIKSCSSVQISINDKLPKNVCEDCYSKLKNAHNFKYLCEDSDRKLREALVKNETLVQTENEVIVKNENKIKLETSDDIEKHSTDLHVNTVKDEDDTSDSSISCIDATEQTNENYIQESSHEDENKYKSESEWSEEGETKPNRSVLLKLEKKFECELCNKKYCRSWELGKHMKIEHHVKGTKCQQCSLLCYHYLHLKDHEQSHSLMKVFCQICNKGFKNNASLKKHTIYHSDEKPFSCNQCDLAFKARSSLKKHTNRVHIKQKLEICQLCGKNIRPYYLEQHLKIHEQRISFPCNQCSKIFAIEKSLTTHIKRVHQNEALKYRHLCNICGRGIISPAALKNHLRSHTGEKPFACDKCNKRYARTSELNFHIKAAHLNERPWICTICNHAFHTRHRLKIHMHQHTGEKPYSCLICGRSFGVKCGLRSHMKTHVTNNP